MARYWGIRKAFGGDHNAILQVAKTSPYTRDFSNTQMFSTDAAYERGWILVAETLINRQIIGFTCVRQKVRSPETTLYFVGVHPEHRGRGVGRQLLEETLRRSPHELLTLNVAKDNQDAQRFYEALRFENTGEEAIHGTAHRWVFRGKVIAPSGWLEEIVASKSEEG